MFTVKEIATHLISALAQSTVTVATTYVQKLDQLNNYRTVRYSLPHQQVNIEVVHEIISQLKNEKILFVTHDNTKVTTDFCKDIGASKTDVVIFDWFIFDNGCEDKEYSTYDTIILERSGTPGCDRLLIDDLAFVGDFKSNVKIFIIG